MDLFADLEKFGLKQTGEFSIMGEEKSKQAASGEAGAEKPIEEKDLLVEKKIRCDICENEITALVLKGSKVRRAEPDADLRPRYEGIDAVKYGVTFCTQCGYAALNKHFNHNSATQRKWLRETVCMNYVKQIEFDRETYSYDYAVEKYKLALVNAMARKAKLSEKAYICLNLAWLRAEQASQVVGTSPEELASKEKYTQEYEAFYRQAYDAFQKVISTETSPYEGMDENTLEYIIVNMAMHFKEYDFAARTVSRLITNKAVPARLRDKLLDIKDEIIKNKSENK